MTKKSEQKHTIVAEVPPSKNGHCRRVHEHGRVIDGDASGDSTLDEHGDVEDIVSLASPSFLRDLGQ